MTTNKMPAMTGEVMTGEAPGAQTNSYRKSTTTPRQMQGATLETPLYVPSDLETVPQWVNWRYAVRDGKTTKIPVNPRTGGNAATNTPSTWSDLETALTYYHEHDTYVSGVGLVVAGTALVGVDLDHCIGDDLTIAPWALAMVRSLASYTEVSPSGTGLRVFGFGSKPGTRSKRGGVELYDHTSTRFLTFTGRHLPGTPLELRDVTAELAVIYSDVFGPEPAPVVRRDPQPVDVDDSALIALAIKAKNGAKFAALWQGVTTGYSSPSEADLALCNSLAWWTGGDEKRIDRMFRQSGLMRDKWNDRHSGDGASYGAMTIAKALELTTTYYSPPQKPVQSHSETVTTAAGGVVVDLPSIADLWRILNAHIHHDGEQCPMCGRLFTEEWEVDDRTDGRYRLYRCKRADCLDWQTHRAKQLVAQSEMHLWPAHFLTLVPVEDYDRLVNRGMLSHADQWRGVAETNDTMFVASAFAIDARSIATRLDALAPMLAERWLSRKPGSRLRDPKKLARAKRAAVVACEAETPAAVVSVVVEPEPKPTRRAAFGLVDMEYSEAHDFLSVLEAAGATVDHKRGRWSYLTADRANIAAVVTTWADVTGLGGRREIDALRRIKPQNVSISPSPAAVEVLVGDLHPDIARMTRQAVARTVTNHGRRSG